MRSNKVLLMIVLQAGGLLFSGTKIYADEIKVGLLANVECDFVSTIKGPYDYLNSVEGIKAEYLGKNWIDKIYDYDVLFLSSGWLSIHDPLDSERRARLWEYVYRGYGLVLAHDSYYGKWYRQVLFPEFQSPEPGVGQRYGWAMKVVKPNHPVALGLDPEFYQCFFEHACFKPSQAKGVEVVCTDVDPEQRPVVVAAEVGKGRVVAAGIYFLIGYEEQPEGANKNTKRLLINSIRWAGGLKDREEKDHLSVRSSIREQLKRNEALYQAGTEISETWYQLDMDLAFLYYQAEDLARAGSGKAKQLCEEISSFQNMAKRHYKILLEKEVSQLKNTNYEKLADWSASPANRYRWRVIMLPESTIDLIRQKVTDLYVSDGHLLKKKEDKVCQPSGEEIRQALKALGSDNHAEQAKGALEAGRMQLGEAVPRLVELLQSDNYEVRRNSIFALSWIMDKSAVVPLMRTVEKDKDIKTRRRAVQALGMIGDGKAVSLLLSLLDSDDVCIKENAVLALGNLKAKEAAPVLLKIIKKPLPAVPRRQGGLNPEYVLQTVAVKALGKIGGSDAAHALRDKLNRTLKDWVPTGGSQSTDPELLYNLCLAIGKAGKKEDMEALKNAYQYKDKFYSDGSPLYYLLAIAISMIRDREDNVSAPETTGIIQPAFLRKKENFYLINDHFQRHVAKGTYFYNRPASERLKHWEAGSAGINGFTGYFSDDICVFPFIAFSSAYKVYPPSVDELISRGEELRSCLRSADKNSIKIFASTKEIVAEAFNLDWILDLMGNSPALGGIWMEEGPVGELAFESDRFNELKKYLAGKYTPAERKELGLTDADLKPEILKNLRNMEFKSKYPVLFTECFELQDKIFLEKWQEGAEWLRQERMNTPILYDTSSVFEQWGSSFSVYGKLGGIIASHGTEPSYTSASYQNSFYADLCGDGGRNIPGMEVYSWRCGNVRHHEIGMGIGILHAQRFMFFDWGNVFKHPGAVCDWWGNWKEGMWEMVVRVYRKIEKVEKYLVHTEMPHGVGLVYSGRSNCNPYGMDKLNDGRRNKRYLQNIIGMYEALKQAHIQFDLIWMETLNKDRLKDYRALVLPNACTLADEERTLIRDWVKQGGVLISTGSTSIRDRWAREKENYQLADVFGVDYKGTRTKDKPDNWRYFLPRDLVEKEYLETFSANGRKVTYDMRAGYDVVKPSTGKVTGTWPDASPAVVVNDYGKGRSIFLTGIGLGLACQAKQLQQNFPLYCSFYPGVVEMLKSLVENAYTDKENKLPLMVENCPLYTEALLKTQDNGKTKIIHFLNYDAERSGRIKDIKVSVLWEKGVPERVFYPDDNTKVPYKKEGDYVVFTIRDLDIHDMVVVEK